MIHLRVAAYLCGLGEIGFSKMFLSPQFGPRCRVGIIMTDVELEPDPIYDGPQLCNRCMACVNNCPGKVFPTDKTVKVNLAGHEVEWSDLDVMECQFHFRGAEHSDKVQETPYMEHDPKSKPGWWSPFFRKPRNLYNTGQAVCGARGCTRACMISLESRGVLQNTFKEKFRRRPTWSVNWDEEPVYDKGSIFQKKAESDHVD